MERDRKDDGGLVSGEEEEEEGRGVGGPGDEMRQRLRAGFKPTMSRVNGMYGAP